MSHKVITPVSVEPIAIEVLRAHLNLTDDETDDDALILLQLSAARAWAENFMGIAIAPQTWEMAFAGFPDGPVELEGGVVSDIGFVKYIDSNGVEQTLSPAAYTLDDYDVPNVLRPAFNTSWPTVQASARSMRVVYDVGASPLEPDIQAALLLHVGHLYLNREEVSASQTFSVPMGIKALLQPHRINLGI